VWHAVPGQVVEAAFAQAIAAGIATAEQAGVGQSALQMAEREPDRRQRSAEPLLKS
jgi:hypothetical protein